MSDKGIVLKIDECELLTTLDEMCAESLPPDLYTSWEEVRHFLIYTRKQLEPLTQTIDEIVALSSTTKGGIIPL